MVCYRTSSGVRVSIRLSAAVPIMLLKRGCLAFHSSQRANPKMDERAIARAQLDMLLSVNEQSSRLLGLLVKINAF